MRPFFNRPYRLLRTSNTVYTATHSMVEGNIEDVGSRTALVTVLINCGLHLSHLGFLLRATLKGNLLVDAALTDSRLADHRFAIRLYAVGELAGLEEIVLGAHVKLDLRAVCLAIRLRVQSAGRFAKLLFWL